eukprot:TRINITY_DN12502_c0_g1_i1.p1 TRINITY_DN12502_c0_g1~~TRINITY_DN12502_c0_g1_i1.p1  ORF type:complete len:792 (+),score=306.96 TRINITY_DN12502_c0_g1_i1:349-2376(+)
MNDEESSDDEEEEQEAEEESEDEKDEEEQQQQQQEQQEEQKKKPSMVINNQSTKKDVTMEIERAKKLAAKSTHKKMQLVGSFEELNLSKPLLRAVKDLGFKAPTPVQARAVPLALKGKDILVNAVTGSGKTAAFVLPILERLLFLPKGNTGTRCVFLCPTRELAAQCYEVVTNLCKYCAHITATLIVGGLSEKAQIVALRQNPHIVIATPGRLLDHLLNSQSVGFEALEVLVLDEADRLLEMGFFEEVDQIVRMCPKNRQTMMFSATLTGEVDQLANLALNEPEKIHVDPLYSLANNLTQEFIRVRQQHDNETHRLATILSLVSRTFTSKTIIFFPSKILAHKAKIIFGLARLNASELHGNLTQSQRLEALEQFREGQVDFLLCTDLAARGLDIKGVQTVINYCLPKQLSQYVHRVGRTARAGCKGHAVCLVGEPDHKLMSEIVKRAPHQVKKRKIPPEVLDQFNQKLVEMQNTVDEIIADEQIERQERIAEMEANKANNVLLHEREIMSRPAKEWFMNGKEKRALKEKTKKFMVGEDEEEKKEEPKKKLSTSDKKKLKIVEQRISELNRRKEENKKAGDAQRRDAKKAKKLEDLKQREIDDDAYTEVAAGRVIGGRQYVSGYDADSFDARYKKSRDLDAIKAKDREKQEEMDSKKRKRPSGTFKSKKRHKKSHQ